MSEFDYYPVFMDWLRRCGNELVVSEVRPPSCNGLEFDIIGARRWKNRKNFYVLTSIEVKELDFAKCYRQAWERLSWCEYCYMAFPVNFGEFSNLGGIIYNLANYLEKLRKYGIGVLVYENVCAKKVWCVLPARMSSKIMKWRKDMLLDMLGLRQQKLDVK